jgi:hypothetical protein
MDGKYFCGGTGLRSADFRMQSAKCTCTQDFRVVPPEEQAWRVTLAKGELKTQFLLLRSEAMEDRGLNSAFAGDTDLSVHVMPGL